MSLQDRSLIFRAVLEAYSNDFSNSGKHSPRFIQQAVMDEATKPGLKADPRLTSTALGAVAVSIGKQLMTHEGLAKNFVDVELGGLGVVATFLKEAKYDLVAENLSPVGQVAQIAKPGDILGEGIVSDVLILAVDPTPAVMEAATAAFKETITEGRLDEKWWNTAIQRIKGAYKALTTPTHHIVTTKLNPEASASDIASLHAKARSIGGGSYLHSANPDDAAPEAMRRAKEGEVIHAFHNATDAKTFAAHAKSQGHSPKVGGAVKANPNTKVESKEDTVTAFTEAQADEIAGPLSLMVEEATMFSHELVVHKSVLPHEKLATHLASWNKSDPTKAGIAKKPGAAGSRVIFKSPKHAEQFKHSIASQHDEPGDALEKMHVKPIHESVIAAAKALASQAVTVRVTTLAQHPGATNTHFVAERLSASKGKVVSEGVKDYIFASRDAVDTFLRESKAIIGGPRHAKVEIVEATPAIDEMAKHNHPITHEAVASTASSFAPSVHVEDKGRASHISGATDHSALAAHLKQKFPHATVGVMQSPVRGEYVHVSHGTNKCEVVESSGELIDWTHPTTGMSVRYSKSGHAPFTTAIEVKKPLPTSSGSLFPTVIGSYSGFGHAGMTLRPAHAAHHEDAKKTVADFYAVHPHATDVVKGVYESAEQVDESNLGSYTSKDGRLKYTISHKPETNEYVAKAYVDGKHHEGKTGYEGYAAGDKEDKKHALDAAHGTAKKNIEAYEKTSIKESEKVAESAHEVIALRHDTRLKGEGRSPAYRMGYHEANADASKGDDAWERAHEYAFEKAHDEHFKTSWSTSGMPVEGHPDYAAGRAEADARRAKVAAVIALHSTNEAEVGKIDKEVWSKAEDAAVKQYGAETREKDSDKFYAITMSIYKKMKHVSEAIAEIGESDEVKSPEHHQKRIEHIKGLIADAPDEDKVRLRQHLDLEKDRLKRAKAKVNENETVDHPILRLHAHATGTIAEGRTQKEILKSMLANFALPGIPGAKNETGNVGFDTAFKAAIAAAKARKGIISESEYATLVDDVAFALVEHFGNDADKVLAEAVVPEFKAPLHESTGPNPATLQQIAKSLLLSADVVPESLSESIQSWREHAATLTA